MWISKKITKIWGKKMLIFFFFFLFSGNVLVAVCRWRKERLEVGPVQFLNRHDVTPKQSKYKAERERCSNIECCLDPASSREISDLTMEDNTCEVKNLHPHVREYVTKYWAKFGSDRCDRDGDMSLNKILLAVTLAVRRGLWETDSFRPCEVDIIHTHASIHNYHLHQLIILKYH